MLKTSDFSQLAPSPLLMVRNRYRVCERSVLPTRLTFLEQCGIDAERISDLRAFLLTEEEERLAAAWILLRIFQGQQFHAAGALRAWLCRKKDKRDEVKVAAENFADDLMEDEFHFECSGATFPKSAPAVRPFSAKVNLDRLALAA